MELIKTNEIQLYRTIYGNMEIIHSDDNNTNKIKKHENFIKTCLPYALLVDKGNPYAYVLNRYYKPLGVSLATIVSRHDMGYVEYEDYPCLITLNAFNEAKKIDINLEKRNWIINLYDDYSQPWSNMRYFKPFFKKLETLNSIFSKI